MDIPNFFTDKSKILNYDFSSLRNFINSDIDFTFGKKQGETINDPKYMGINTFTMGPQDIYGGLHGMYMNIHLRKSKL